MAKKKSNKFTKAPNSQKRLPTKEGRRIDKESMKEKVEIKSPSGGDKASRIVGTIFIGLGILLVAFGVYSFLKFRSEPTFNEELEVATIDQISELTNAESIKIKGNAPGYDSVALFLNDEKVAEARVKDEMYEFNYEIEEEGEYTVAVAALKGFPLREIGPRSESQIAIVDRTPPDADNVELKYAEETAQSTFTLTGTTEANVSIEVRRGVNTYETVADENGVFKVEEISLDEGKNVFYLNLTDPAGNTVSLDEKVRIAYSPGADLNGDGVSDGRDVAGADDTLPQASGEFDNLLIRNLMLIFGIASLFVFTGSSVYALNRRK
jgi:hypothetical protein